ncbi:hypothetical protein ACFQH6_02095 [Halobacteriaceae archaeon GCM10025711]
MVTSNLAALVAVGFYAMFDLEDYPSRSHIETTAADWLQSLDWVEEPEGRERNASGTPTSSKAPRRWSGCWSSR